MYLSKAINGYEDEYYISLAGMATVSDVMPLVEENLLIVAKAIKFLNKNKYHNFNLLSENINIYDEKTFGMKMSPKINSVGRICENNEANYLVDFFVKNDKKKINEIYDFIDSTNKKRKKITTDYFNDLKIDSNKKYIFIASDEILEGVAGLIASNLVNNYGLTTFVFAAGNEENVYKGSARSAQGFDLEIFLDQNKELFLAYGGHKKAAGISILKSNLSLLEDKIEAFCSNIDEVESKVDVILTSIDEINIESYKLIREFAPFGEAREEPLYLIKGVDSNIIKKSKDGKHLLINLSKEAKMVYFNYSGSINKEKKYDFIFTLDIDKYDNKSVTCMIKEMFESDI